MRPAQELTPPEILEWPFPTDWRVVGATGTRIPLNWSAIWRDRDLSISASDGPEDDRYLVAFAEDLTFEIDLAKQQICVENPGNASPDTIRHLVLDQIYPRILAHQGNVVVHAACVMIGAQAILLLGASGAGKSTLAASFHSDGKILIGDDAVVAAMRGPILEARAVYRSLRLLEDSLDGVLPDARQLSRVADYTSKQNVGGLSGEHPRTPVPVGAIFILDERPATHVEVTPTDGADMCMALVEQCFALDPTDVEGARTRLSALAEILSAVSVFRVRYPRDYGRLTELKRAIADAVDRNVRIEA